MKSLLRLSSALLLASCGVPQVDPISSAGRAGLGTQDPAATKTGLTAFHWALFPDAPTSLVTRIPVHLNEDASCRIIYAQLSGPSDAAFVQMVSDTLLPEGTWPARVSGSASSGSSEELTYIDAIGYRSVRRTQGGYMAEIIILRGELPAGQLVITQISAAAPGSAQPTRRGSIECDRAFDIVDARIGTEVEFFDIGNAGGIAHDSALGASASLVEFGFPLESALAGVIVSGDGSLTLAAVQGPDGEEPLLGGGFHDVAQGPGAYELSMNTATDGHSTWFAAGYGMDRSLDLDAIRVETSPFQERCTGGFCFLY